MLDDDHRAFLQGTYRHHPDSPGNPDRPIPPASTAALNALRWLHELNQRWDSVRGLEYARTNGMLVDELVDGGLIVHDRRTATCLQLTPRGWQAVERTEAG